MAADHPIAREVADRQVTMFAMFVGVGLFTTRAALSRASGIPESTLREWANGAAMPFHGALILSKYLPLEAINMIAEPGGKRFADALSAASNWDSVAAAFSDMVASICKARSDGRIDHVEDAELRTFLRVAIGEASRAIDGCEP